MERKIDSPQASLRKQWTTPSLKKLDAGSAEVGQNSNRIDGPLNTQS